MKSFIEFISEDVSSFSSKMNNPNFHPSVAQMQDLVKTTSSVMGSDKLGVTGLKDFDKHAGTGTYVKNGKKYKAVRLKSNDKWYLTGEYETA